MSTMNNKPLEQRVQDIEDALKNIPTKEEFESLVRTAMGDVVRDAGHFTKVSIITVATIIGSLAVIFGGLKALLTFIGITITR